VVHLLKNLDELCVNTLRFLAVDAVEKANSGHPGLPLGAAPMAYVLWDRFLRHNPQNPAWINRDRFILSAGHGSALLYALLHVYGYKLPLDELKRFRQWESRTPGHPEYGFTPGVEATTGPLGQGFAMGVGMAIAERMLANCFNTPEFSLIDHFIYAIVSDGDLMEGVSSEAASLAGTLGLGKLIYLYDDNHISIEGETDIAFTENVQRRFEAYNWHVIRVPDGNDLDEIEAAIRAAQTITHKPTLILVRTHIGYGSPKQDTSKVHGEPLGQEALTATKNKLGWPLEPSFFRPKPAINHFRQAVQKGQRAESEWRTLLAEYATKEPDFAQQFGQARSGSLPSNLEKFIPSFTIQDGPIATRNASGQVLNTLNQNLHTLGQGTHHVIVGGSADLSPSTKTILTGYGDFGFTQDCAHNIHYGVREHAMGAIANGIALHSNFIPYTATFLIFSDYMRPAIRLAALMQTHVIFIFTHDSIGLGEDGPTHQPVEHLMSLRAIPGLTVIRPSDANETAIAWQVAIEQKRPVALVLTRQQLPVLDSRVIPIKKGVPRGAYVVAEASSGTPEIIIIATGSEVHLALSSREMLQERGIQTRVVSMPSWELYEQQSVDYQLQVLLPDIPKVAIEAGVTLGWSRYVGSRGDVIGLNRFGASAKGDIVYTELGFNVKNVVNRVMKLLVK
jgi:transketolase